MKSLLKTNSLISFEPYNFRERLECIIEYQTANSEIIKLNLAYGHFTLFILLINIDEISPLINLHLISSGAFGEIYEAYGNDKSKVAIKRIEIKEIKFEQTLYSVMRELFLLNIASALGIGPKMRKIYGFDLVIYRNTIEFSMEFCERYDANDSTKLEDDLKKKLKLLHRCHIVHNDIKP